MIVGLTGGIASGKSESSKYFEELGAYCIDADAISKELTSKCNPALRDIVDGFGTDVLLFDGTLDRKKLANIIFSDSKAKLKVEKILHAHIISRINEIVSNKISERKVIIINAPLLFETGLDRICNKIVVVKVPHNIQVRRLRLRDGLNDDEIKKRIDSQMPVEERVKLADFVVDNSGSKKELKKNIENIYELLTSTFE